MKSMITQVVSRKIQFPPTPLSTDSWHRRIVQIIDITAHQPTTPVTSTVYCINSGKCHNRNCQYLKPHKAMDGLTSNISTLPSTIPTRYIQDK